MVEEPFRQIGEETGIPESEVISRIAASKEKNIVRQISAIFDTRKLGYKTVLVAMRLPHDSLDSGARVINEHPGVSHNYARNGPFNLWFTLAVPPEDSLENTVEEMAGRAGAESYRLMPTIRFFKIGVNFDMVKREGAAEDYYSPDGYDKNGGQDFKRPAPVTDFEKDAIRELQEDMPLVPRPFEPMADALGITQRQLFDLAADFERRGIMRRFSAVLHHRRAGFKANAMAVWNVPEERSVEVGAVMAQSRWVTHCYERPPIRRLALFALHDDSRGLAGQVRGGRWRVI